MEKEKENIEEKKIYNKMKYFMKKSLSCFYTYVAKLRFLVSNFDFHAF